MNNKQLKDIGLTVTQIGTYLMTLGDLSLFKDNDVHRNIITLLSQLSLKLDDTMRENAQVINAPVVVGAVICDNKYITKQEVIKIFYPLITQYGLDQAIRTKDIPCIKRGKKYFFVEADVKEWINSKRSANNVRTTEKLV